MQSQHVQSHAGTSLVARVAELSGNIDAASDDLKERSLHFANNHPNLSGVWISVLSGAGAWGHGPGVSEKGKGRNVGFLQEYK